MPRGKGNGLGGGTAAVAELAKSNANNKSKQGSSTNSNATKQQASNNNNRKRTNSGHGKKPGQDNNSNNKKLQDIPARVQLFNANNRYGKGGRNFSGPPNAPADLLTPIVPPLYPPTSAPQSLKTSSLDKVAVYKRFSRFYKINCKVKISEHDKSPFHVGRYTDMYKAPLTLNSDIFHRLHHKRVHKELSSASPFKKPRKPKPTASKVTKIIKEIDVEDEEENPDKRGAEKDKKKANDDDVEPPVDVLEEVNFTLLSP